MKLAALTGIGCLFATASVAHGQARPLLREGETPGFFLGGMHVPLNVDAYFFDTVAAANSPTFLDTFGNLDAEGEASASLLTPADISLVGLTAHHAVMIWEIGPLVVHGVSAAKSVVLLP